MKIYKYIICSKCNKQAGVSRSTYFRHKKRGEFNCNDCANNIISESSKKLWNDTTYRSKITTASSNKDSKVLSETAKKLWATHEYRTKMLAVYESTEYRDKLRDAWNRPGYRDTYVMGKDEFVNRANEVHAAYYDYSKVIYVSATTKVTIICPKHGEFYQSPANHIHNNNGCPKCIKSISIPQQEIIDFIKSLNICEMIINDKTIIPPLELDIVLPEYNLAIEHHGIYWHSYDEPETAKQINKHKIKAELAEKCGIKLFQILETDWLYKREIVCSMILNACKKSTSIYARKCDIVNIDNTTAKQFFDSNHLQGHRSASICVGLCYDSKLVSAISLSKHHKYGYELIRFATLGGYHVAGGLSKLLCYVNKVYSIEQIMTYADRRYSIAEAYKKCGFKLLGATKPNYFYVSGNNLYSRQHFQKHKLSKLLDNFDNTKSEPINMFNNGFRRLWDAGHYKLLLTSF